MSEAELIQGCIRNDRKCQEQLYKQHFPVMMSMCLKYTKDEDKALLILNDGFLKVFQKIGTFRSEGSFEGWIRRLIYHTMADYYKKENSYIRFIQFELPDEKHAQVPQSDPLEFQDLIGLLDRIPGRSAEVFRLFAIEGYSHEEIGVKMNISTGTSKWHLSNARERLRSLIVNENHARTSSI
ncbi:MAG: sigma-70 family RNA polymerase sigma factor [Saprospiraceae bacterium]|uniref:Sigma-70 family RNA polymerase sigma factor n=1 Tax=Candidatus Opimibacter skivensis TaxID=2982028 RepID=A0A9D7SRS5_9BACT|nr:sigma-70 family RNA polymerase sigma factor [Candidatus Opimibacter skivensis]